MLKLWFMYDRHVFAPIKMGNRASLIEQAIKFFKEDGCGSLFARDEMDGDIHSLCCHGHRLGKDVWGVTREEAEAWADQVLLEDSFRRLVA